MYSKIITNKNPKTVANKGFFMFFVFFYSISIVAGNEKAPLQKKKNRFSGFTLF